MKITNPETKIIKEIKAGTEYIKKSNFGVY